MSYPFSQDGPVYAVGSNGSGRDGGQKIVPLLSVHNYFIRPKGQQQASLAADGGTGNQPSAGNSSYSVWGRAPQSSCICMGKERAERFGLCHKNATAGERVMEAISGVPQSLKLRSAAVFLQGNGEILLPGVFDAAAENEAHQRPTQGEGENQNTHAYMYQRPGGCAGALPERSCVYRSAEERRYTHKSQKASKELFGFSEGNESHGYRGHGPEKRVIQKGKARYNTETAPQRTYTGTQGEQPSTVGKGAYLCRGQQEKIVDNEVQKKKLIQINDFHGTIVARMMCEAG